MASSSAIVSFPRGRSDLSTIARLTCGIDSLDRYLRTQAGQDIRRRANGVFVMVDSEQPSSILAYDTLAATSLRPGDVPEAARPQVPRYPLVSATLIGRLAMRPTGRDSGLVRPSFPMR
jgi:hypothetical protein